MKRFVAILSVPAALAIAGCSHPQDNPPPTSSTQSMSMSHGDHIAMSDTDAKQASAVDVHNTVCPVSGEKVDASSVTETYHGKVYHLCDKDCAKQFKESPDKFAKAVDDNPAKYGTTPQQ